MRNVDDESYWPCCRCYVYTFLSVEGNGALHAGRFFRFKPSIFGLVLSWSSPSPQHWNAHGVVHRRITRLLTRILTDCE